MTEPTEAILYYGFPLDLDTLSAKTLNLLQTENPATVYAAAKGIKKPQGDGAADWIKWHQEFRNLLDYMDVFQYSNETDGSAPVYYVSANQYYCQGQNITSLDARDLWNRRQLTAKLKDFCDILEIPWTTPQWHLIIYQDRDAGNCPRTNSNQTEKEINMSKESADHKPLSGSMASPLSDPHPDRDDKRRSFLYGACGALSVLGLYTILTILVGNFSTLVSYGCGMTLFAALLAVLYLILKQLQKLRNSAAKQVAIWDLYTGVSIVTVLGFFAAACVQTFVVGGKPLELWTYAGLATVGFAAAYGIGKAAGKVWQAGGNEAKSK